MIDTIETNTQIATETPRRTRAKASTHPRRPSPASEPTPEQNDASGTTQSIALSHHSGRTRADSTAQSGKSPPASEPIQQIAATETKRRGKGAKFLADAIRNAPSSQAITSVSNDRDGDDGAKMRTVARKHSPHVATTEAGANKLPDANGAAPPSSAPIGSHDFDAFQNMSATEDGGAKHLSEPNPGPPLHPAIPALIAMQRQRTFAIKSQQRIDRACESFIASSLGFSVEMEGGDRKEIFARATKIRRRIEKGAATTATSGHTPPPSKRPAKAIPQSDLIVTDEAAVADACSPIILASLMARSAWDAMRSGAEKEMRRLAEELPVWEWSVGVKGFGALGVAIIAAEASGPRGDVGSYATKERLWKRLGLAVIEGSRQRRVSDAIGAEQHGYNPRRRAEIWTIADSMFRHQWAGANEESGTAPHPVGPYGAVYMRRKSHTESREWPGGRRENDARRVMTKALIEDYWRVWRGMEPLAVMP